MLRTFLRPSLFSHSGIEQGLLSETLSTLNKALQDGETYSDLVMRLHSDVYRGYYMGEMEAGLKSAIFTEYCVTKSGTQPQSVRVTADEDEEIFESPPTRQASDQTATMKTSLRQNPATRCTQANNAKKGNCPPPKPRGNLTKKRPAATQAVSDPKRQRTSTPSARRNEPATPQIPTSPPTPVLRSPNVLAKRTSAPNAAQKTMPRPATPNQTTPRPATPNQPTPKAPPRNKTPSTSGTISSASSDVVVLGEISRIPSTSAGAHAADQLMRQRRLEAAKAYIKQINARRQAVDTGSDAITTTPEGTKNNGVTLADVDKAVGK